MWSKPQSGLVDKIKEILKHFPAVTDKRTSHSHFYTMQIDYKGQTGPTINFANDWKHQKKIEETLNYSKAAKSKSQWL